RAAKLVVQDFFLWGIDERVEAAQLVGQDFSAGIHLPFVNADVLGVGVQRHAQRDGTDSQHGLADVVDQSHARHPVALDRHFALANVG
nr:hypothetical protein [Tanacetum cinerariifolium]